MPCGCSRRGGSNQGSVSSFFMGGQNAQHLSEPPQWGPVLWKLLHCLTEHIGKSGSSVVDTDQANYMETLLTMLPLIVPCSECQAHAASYLDSHPLPALKGLYQQQLRDTIRLWLFEFHNAVRTQKGQTIIVQTPEECSALYAGCNVARCDYNSFIQSVAAAVRQGLVRMDHWRKWYSYSEKLRIITGNVVM
jgi:Erv1 / Alr family